ncbi:hypothetical protein ACN27F_23375 [Solwaraspora sp. WMMB335]|uniref:hypothetical protein n=1 Tax=Solwaraspora sp. WMMB335 TaxID=3404118 RepID=UPI003B936DE2
MSLLADGRSVDGAAAVPDAPSRRRAVPPHGGRTFAPTTLGLGAVIPVLGAHSQAGTSGIALAVADAAARTGRRVLLVDCADPARSGLAGACDVEGRSVAGTRRAAGIRLASRHLPRGIGVSVRRLLGTGTPMRPDELPTLTSWVAADHNEFDLTVVDIGWDVWSLTVPDSGLGPLTWATGRPGEVFPMIVMRATAASVALAEGVLTRYLAGVEPFGLVQPHGVAVVGAGSWPARTRNVMGFQLARLAHRALFVPASSEAAVAGWTTDPAPTASVRAATALLKTVNRSAAPATRTNSPSRRGAAHPAERSR